MMRLCSVVLNFMSQVSRKSERFLKIAKKRADLAFPMGIGLDLFCFQNLRIAIAEER
jgi:hypothetical protein